MSMQAGTRAIAFASAAILALLVGSFFWAGRQQGLGEGFAAVMEQPWGVVTVLDLYTGLLFVAAWIHALERDWRKTLGWSVALATLGNVATLAYLIWRARQADSWGELFTARHR